MHAAMRDTETVKGAERASAVAASVRSKIAESMNVSDYHVNVNKCVNILNIQRWRLHCY